MLVKVRLVNGKPRLGADELHEDDAAFILRLLTVGVSGTDWEMDAFLEFVHVPKDCLVSRLQDLVIAGWVDDTINFSPGRMMTIEVVAPNGCYSVPRGQVSRPVRNKYTDGFEAFWKVYPRRVNKAKAFRAWKSAAETVSEEILIDAAKRYAKYHEAVGTDQQYIKHPTTWLNGGEWDSMPVIPSLLRKPPSPEYESLHIDDLEAWTR